MHPWFPKPMHKEPYGVGTGDSGLRATAHEFLEFQRGFLRQRWASYYAIWAGAVVAFFLVPVFLGFTSFSTMPLTARLATLAGIDLVLTATALAVTVLLWGLAARTSEIRDAASGRLSLTSTRNLVRFAIVLAIVVGSIAISTRSSFASILVADTSLVVLSLFLLLHLRRAFRPIPFEGWLAATAFISAAAVSYVSLLLLDYPLGHLVGWSAAIVVWLGCAAFCRFGVLAGSEGS